MAAVDFDQGGPGRKHRRVFALDAGPAIVADLDHVQQPELRAERIEAEHLCLLDVFVRGAEVDQGEDAVGAARHGHEVDGVRTEVDRVFRRGQHRLGPDVPIGDHFVAGRAVGTVHEVGNDEPGQVERSHARMAGQAIAEACRRDRGGVR